MKRIAIYAGSFNPFHIGHLDILRQSRPHFSHITVVRAQNPTKEAPIHPMSTTRLETKLRDKLGSQNLRVVNLPDQVMLTTYIQEMEEAIGEPVTLIRGLRNGYDLEYEMNQQYYMKMHYPGLKIVYFVADKEFTNLSSRGIRALMKLTGNLAETLVV